MGQIASRLFLIVLGTSISVIWVLSYYYSLAGVYPNRTSIPHFDISIDRGLFVASLYSTLPRPPRNSEFALGFRNFGCCTVDMAAMVTVRQDGGFYLMPLMPLDSDEVLMRSGPTQILYSVRSRSIVIHMSFLVTLLLMLPAWSVAKGILVRRNRAAKNRCIKCGYSRHGCSSSHCPECGIRHADKAASDDQKGVGAE